MLRMFFNSSYLHALNSMLPFTCILFCGTITRGLIHDINLVSDTSVSITVQVEFNCDDGSSTSSGTETVY